MQLQVVRMQAKGVTSVHSPACERYRALRVSNRCHLLRLSARSKVTCSLTAATC